MPIYFSSEDGKYYNSDFSSGITGERIYTHDYIESLKQKRNFSPTNEQDKIDVFLQKIGNYVNRTFLFHNFSGISEINSIVDSGITYQNGQTFDKYYEALSLKKWREKVIALSGSLIESFSDGLTSLPNAIDLIQTPSFPTILKPKDITGSYFTDNLFRNGNYNYYSNRNNDLSFRGATTSPLVIEEIKNGLSASITGGGTISDDCITDPIMTEVVSDENIEIYNFPTVHFFGYNPGQEVYNFVENPTYDTMLEAFFGGGTFAQEIFGPSATNMGMYGVPLPLMSVQGGFYDENDNEDVLAGMIVEGATFNQSYFSNPPHGGPWSDREILDALDDAFQDQDYEQFNEDMRRSIYEMCQRIKDGLDLPGIPKKYFTPGWNDEETRPEWDTVGPTGTTATFDDYSNITLPWAPPIVNSIIRNSGIDTYLAKLLQVSKNTLTKHCPTIYDSTSVNWYDPQTNPCGVVYYKMCCNRNISTSVKIDFDSIRINGIPLSVYLGLGQAAAACGAIDWDDFVGATSDYYRGLFDDPNLPEDYTPTISDILDKFSDIYENGFEWILESVPLDTTDDVNRPNCVTMNSPNRYSIITSPCFDFDRCKLPIRHAKKKFPETKIFRHKFMFYVMGGCLADFLKASFRKTLCKERIGQPIVEDILEGFKPFFDHLDGVLGKIFITLDIKLSGHNDIYYSLSGNCGCDFCPCSDESCLNDPNCVDTKIPSLYLPNAEI